MKIKFTKILDVPDMYAPKPIKKILPDWYKNTEEYINGNKMSSTNGQQQFTIKKCIPVFDAITAGYIITTYTDIYINPIVTAQSTKESVYHWQQFEPITMHTKMQGTLHPGYNGADFPKFNTAWSIKTPKGYSSLFINPMHNPNKIFTILEGIVDTDSYAAPINFPFILNDLNFEGIIPAGTPIAQIIPFKRDNWQMEFGDAKEFEQSRKDSILLRSKYFHGYKTLFWNRKKWD